MRHGDLTALLGSQSQLVSHVSEVNGCVAARTVYGLGRFALSNALAWRDYWSCIRSHIWLHLILSQTSCLFWSFLSRNDLDVVELTTSANCSSSFNVGCKFLGRVKATCVLIRGWLAHLVEAAWVLSWDWRHGHIGVCSCLSQMIVDLVVFLSKVMQVASNQESVVSSWLFDCPSLVGWSVEWIQLVLLKDQTLFLVCGRREQVVSWGSCSYFWLLHNALLSEVLYVV